MSTYCISASQTYSDIDVEKVVRRFKADILMLAQSTAGATEEKAREYAHDVELLAKKGYLEAVDLTLLASGVEVRAVRYTVNEAAGELENSRPGGLNWPRVADPHLRIVLFYSSSYTDSARATLVSSLKIGWVASSDDTTHRTLAATGGRDYASNGWGMQRKDYSA